jgi:lipoprotein-anchoring transpeptidase ErfK/SrfK
MLWTRRFPVVRSLRARPLWWAAVIALVLGLALSVPAPTLAQELGDPGPGRWQTGDKEVVVSLGAERLWAYEGDQLVLTTLVSTGTAQTAEVATPLGQYRILVKLPMETMTGTVNGTPYEVDDVPYVMYFTNEGHALHGTYWHNNFGTPMSHGCVNLPMDVAEWMYRWAPEGTAVTIIP